jgi:hypothetical protein
MGKLRIGLWPTATAVAGCFSSVVGSTVQPPDESQGAFFFYLSNGLHKFL